MKNKFFCIFSIFLICCALVFPLFESKLKVNAMDSGSTDSSILDDRLYSITPITGVNLSMFHPNTEGGRYYGFLLDGNNAYYEDIYQNNFSYASSDFSIDFEYISKVRYSFSNYFINVVQYNLTAGENCSFGHYLDIDLENFVFNAYEMSKFGEPYGTSVSLGKNYLFEYVRFSGSVKIVNGYEIVTIPIDYYKNNISRFSVLDFLSEFSIDINPVVYITGVSIEAKVSDNVPASSITYRFKVPSTIFEFIPDIVTFINAYDLDSSAIDDFSLDGILDSVTSFLDVEIIPNVSIANILFVLVGLTLLIAILKIFFGG